MRLITFLGTGNYAETCYSFNDQKCQTRYVAAALATFLEADEVTVLATEQAFASHAQGLTEELERLQLPCPNILSIPSGGNTKELWQQFEIISDAVIAGDVARVSFDITHGFRAQPFFAAAVINYLRSTLESVPEMQAFYGEWRKDETISPVWDISTFIDLLNWSSSLQSFIKTGHGGALANLAKNNNNALQKQAQGGANRPFLLGKLATALNSFSDDISTVRCGNLIVGKQNNGLGSAKHLINIIEESREEVSRYLPPLAATLSELQSKLEDLTSPSLFGEQGHHAMAALAQLYVTYERYPEALITMREGWISLYADATKPNAELWSERVSVTEELFRLAEGKHAITIADFRNDVEHGGFNINPSPAKTLRKQTEKLVSAFAEASAKPIPTKPVGKTYFISRHPGAVAWAESEGFHVDEQLAHFDAGIVKEGDRVFGTLPINLVAEVNAKKGMYFHLTLELPEGVRGKELSADEMRSYGARLESYSVKHNPK